MKANFWLNKTVIITGATSGLGKAITKILLEKGAKVVAISRSEESLKGLKNELVSFAENLFLIKADVTVKKDCKYIFKTVEDELKTADLLINNAGVGLRCEVEEIDELDLRKVFDTNFFGAFYMMQYGISFFKRQGKGTIVNICSLGVKRPVPFTAGYTASKAALSTLADAERLELKKDGISVLCAYPGSISTDFRKNALGKPYPENEVRLSRLLPEIAAKRIIRGIEKGKIEIYTSKKRLSIYSFHTAFSKAF
jgi:short-subunit dehydrogenase